MSNKIKDGGMHAKRVMGDIITYIFLIVLSVIWLIPFFWLVMQSSVTARASSSRPSCPRPTP